MVCPMTFAIFSPVPGILTPPPPPPLLNTTLSIGIALELNNLKKIDGLTPFHYTTPLPSTYSAVIFLSLIYMISKI